MATYNRQIVDDEGNPIFVNGNPAYIKQAETIGEGSLYGALSINEQEVRAVRVRTEKLEGRHSVLIINTGNTDVYVGFDSEVSGTNGIPISSKQERVFSVNPSESLELFVYSPMATTLKIVEVK